VFSNETATALTSDGLVVAYYLTSGNTETVFTTGNGFFTVPAGVNIETQAFTAALNTGKTAVKFSIGSSTATSFTPVAATGASQPVAPNSIIAVASRDVSQVKRGMFITLPSADGLPGQGYVVRVVSLNGLLNHRQPGLVFCSVTRGFNLKAEKDFWCDALGTAYAEGHATAAVDSLAYRRPYRLSNTTRIHETAFYFPGSVLKMGEWWDKEGPYKERLRDALLEHMVGMEKAVLFSRRASAKDGIGGVAINPLQDSGYKLNGQRADSPFDGETRSFSGILEWLELWDAGVEGLNLGDGNNTVYYNFKPNTTGNDQHDLTRIIRNPTGTISPMKLDILSERLARYNSNKTTDRLIVAGAGAVLALNQMLRKNTYYRVTEPATKYGTRFQSFETPFGNYHVTTHPLFNIDPVKRYWMLILDLPSIKYRPLTDRDTYLIKNTQASNGDDFRRDLFRTEFGLEFWNPAAHMLVQKVEKYDDDIVW
jgi:hypothetical protein